MHPLRPVALVFLLFLLSGCNGGSSPPAASTDLVLSSTGGLTVQPDVRVLPTDGSVGVVAITDDSVTLTGDVASIKAGDVIVLNEGPVQFLRKALFVSRAGSRVVISTGEAQLTDVFTSADLERTVTISPEALAGLQPVLPGQTFGRVTRQKGRAVRIPIRFDHVTVLGQDGHVGLILDGEVLVDVTFEVALDVNAFGVRRFRFVPVFAVQGDLTVTGTAETGFQREIAISPKISAPLTPLGPVALTADFELHLTVDASLQARGTTALSGSVTAKFGPEFRSGAWSLVRDVTTDYQVRLPQVQAASKLYVSVAAPRVGLTALGIVNLWCRSDLIKAGIEARLTDTPSAGLLLRADGFFHLAAGVKLLFTNLYQIPALTLGPYVLAVETFIPLRGVIDVVVETAHGSQVRVGEIIQLEPVADFDAASLPQDVTVAWTQQSSDGGRVAFGPDDQVQGVAPGQVTLTATFLDKSATFDVTVLPATLEGIVITGDTTPHEGALLHLTATARFSDGSTLDVSDDCTWTSSDSSVLDIGLDGMEYAVEAGTARVTATYPDFTGSSVAASGAGTVTVLAADIVQFDVEPAVGGRVKVGESLQLTAHGFVGDASKRDVTSRITWTSSDPAVASVDAAATVRFLSPGVVTVTALDPETGQSETRDYAVSHAELSSVRIEGAPSTLQRGASVTLTGQGIFNDATTEDLTTATGSRWLSSNPSVATVSPSGVVTALGVGATEIFFQEYGRQDVVAINVTGPTQVAYAPAPTAAQSGSPFSVTVSLRDTAGQPVSLSGQAVTLRLAPGTQGFTLDGTLTATITGSTATFDNVVLNGAGTVALEAICSGLTSATSSVTVSP